MDPIAAAVGGFIVGVVCILAIGWLISNDATLPSPTKEYPDGRKVFSAVFPPRSCVELRENHPTRSRRWRTEVRYDSWGTPYVKGPNGHFDISLHKDGRTSDHWFCGTEWQLVSGPPVDFSKERPRYTFGSANRDPNVIPQAETTSNG